MRTVNMKLTAVNADLYDGLLRMMAEVKNLLKERGHPEKFDAIINKLANHVDGYEELIASLESSELAMRSITEMFRDPNEKEN